MPADTLPSTTDSASSEASSVDQSPSVPTDDQAAHPPAITATKEIEREHASDSAISLSLPLSAYEKMDHEMDGTAPESASATEQPDPQDSALHNGSAIESEEADRAPSPDATSDAAQDAATDSNAMDSTDPYTEQDPAYKDTVLESSTPVPTKTKSDGKTSDGQAGNSQAKTAPTGPNGNRGQGSNHHGNNNRHHHKGGRGGFFNNRNNVNNFHNNNNANGNVNNNGGGNNNNRPFNQRPFAQGNHGNHGGHNNNVHPNNNNNNNNVGGNFNGGNNNFNGNNNNNHQGGPGPMRRGGYRGAQDQRPYRREEPYRAGRQPDYYQQRPRDNFNNNGNNPNPNLNHNGSYNGPNQYQQQQQQQPHQQQQQQQQQPHYQQRHPQQQPQQMHQQHHHQHQHQQPQQQQQPFPNNGPARPNQQRFQGPDHNNDRQRPPRMPRGPPPEPNIPPQMQNPSLPPGANRPQKTGPIKSIFDYAKGMQWDR
ncbi:hypothetical protein BGZ98_002362, partial [Dissophora globulifera]